MVLEGFLQFSAQLIQFFRVFGCNHLSAQLLNPTLEITLHRLSIADWGNCRVYGKVLSGSK